MSMSSFSSPTRQSGKGIIIIFLVNFYNVIKKSIGVIIAFGVVVERKTILENKILIVLISVGILSFFTIHAILTYRHFKFHITTTNFYLTKGILKKENTVIPKATIQNIYIKQNIIQQLINVVALNVETAGDETTEIEIKALSKVQAAQLKQELLVNNTPKTSANNDAQPTVFHKPSAKKIILEGFALNHFKTFGVIITVLYSFFQQNRHYIENLKLEDKVKHWYLIDDNVFFKISFFVILSVIITILISAGKTFFVNYNLSVVEKNNNLEIKKGLLKKTHLSLTPSRIQNIDIITNRLRKYLDLYTIAIKQAMTDKKTKDNFSIIALNKTQIHAFLDKIYANYNSQNTTGLQKPEPYYVRLLILFMSLIVLGINIIAFLVLKEQFWVVNTFLLPFAFFYIYIKYKKIYYCISDNYITVGSGLIDTKTEITAHHKIQMVRYSQSMFQKLKNIASVKIYTASNEVNIIYVTQSKAIAITNYLLYKAESSNKDWL